MFKKFNNSLAKSIFLFCLFIFFSYFGFSVVFGYGGSRGFFNFSPSAPPSVTAVNVPLAVSNIQQGSAEKVFNNGSVVSIDVPKGAVSGQTTFEIKLGVFEHSKSKMLNSGINLIGDNIYSISAKDIDGREVSSFSGDLLFDFFVPDIPDDSSGLAVYYFNESGRWTKILNSTIDGVGKKVIFSTNHLTDFGIFRNSEDFLNIDSRVTANTVIDLQNDVSADSLYDKDKDLVENVSINEAREVNSQNSFVKMSEDAGYVYVLVLKNNRITVEKNGLYPIAHFIQNGTKTTLVLGEGERGGVLSSYFSAFGKMPEKESEWQDLIKIANGRWPNLRSDKTEKNVGLQNFKRIYNREADLSNRFDSSAVMIMSYGLRPRLRNMDSEKIAIGYFESIWGHKPLTASEWDAVRAIAYSGARR